MIKWLSKKLTKNHNAVPLFYTTFNLNKYQEHGEEGLCDLKIHPYLQDDPIVLQQMKDLVTHIRKNYDMEKLVK